MYSTPPKKYYIRRRFGGRQPLWGKGVTSWIAVTSNPAACRERTAASRPEPGPLTITSTVRIPCSIAVLAADSAAVWAAKGVLFREPLNPLAPAVDQAMVLPLTSLMVMTVLLKVD